MKKLVLLGIIAVGLSSCSGWYGNQEEAFMKQCMEGSERGYENSGLDEAQVEEMMKQAESACECSLEKIKKEYSYDEYVEEQRSEKARSIMQGCFEEEFDMELD